MSVERSCGDCRLCCKTHQIYELKKPRGQWCEHACSKGCSIYADRPKGCRDFDCLWLISGMPEFASRAADIFPIEERPDVLRVVFTAFAGGIRHPDTMVMYRGFVAHESFPGVVDTPRVQKAIQRLLAAGYAVAVNGVD